MSTTFDSLVKDQGHDLWRMGSEHRKSFHHGAGCHGTSWLIGGRGCTFECERWLEDALLQVAHTQGIWTWPKARKARTGVKGRSQGPRRPSKKGESG